MNKIITYISNKISQWNNPGMQIPLAKDGDNKPSITLLMVWLSFLAVLSSLIYLHIYPDRITPPLVTILLFSITLIIYRMRKLQKMKFDLDDKSFEIDSDDENDNTTKPEGKQ